MKLANCKSALNPLVVYSTDCSKAVVPVLVLLFLALWFVLKGVLLYVFPCVILFLCVFCPFGVAVASLGGEGAGLGAFCAFVRFVLVWVCRFPLPLGVWEGLCFVSVALPGLFSYLFFFIESVHVEYWLCDLAHPSCLQSSRTLFSVQVKWTHRIF